MCLYPSLIVLKYHSNDKVNTPHMVPLNDIRSLKDVAVDDIFNKIRDFFIYFKFWNYFLFFYGNSVKKLVKSKFRSV